MAFSRARLKMGASRWAVPALLFVATLVQAGCTGAVTTASDGAPPTDSGRTDEGSVPAPGSDHDSYEAGIQDAPQGQDAPEDRTVAPDAVASQDAASICPVPDASEITDGTALVHNGDLDGALTNSCLAIPPDLSCNNACTAQNAGAVCRLPNGCPAGETDLLCVCDQGAWQCPACWSPGGPGVDPYIAWCPCQQPADLLACTPQAPPPFSTVCHYASGGGVYCSCSEHDYALDGGLFYFPSEGGPPPDGSFVARSQWSCAPAIYPNDGCPLSPYQATGPCSMTGRGCSYYVGTNSAGGIAASVDCACDGSNQWSCRYQVGSSDYPTPGGSCVGRPRGFPMPPGSLGLPQGYSTCTCEGACNPVWHCTP
jgi:hypothetical protein